MKKVIYLIFIFLATNLTAQIALIPSEKTFILYDFKANKRLKEIDYLSIGGVCWRFSTDGKYLFYKMNSKDAYLIKRNFLTGVEEKIETVEVFTDYQLLNNEKILLRSDIGFFIYDMLTKERTHVDVGIKQWVATVFAYDSPTNSMFLQNEKGSLERWGSDGKRELIDVNLVNAFSYKNGIVCYSKDSQGFTAYNVATKEKTFYTWAKNNFNLLQVIAINSNLFLLNGMQEGKEVYRLYDASNQKIGSVILDLVLPLPLKHMLPKIINMSMLDVFENETSFENKTAFENETAFENTIM